MFALDDNRIRNLLVIAAGIGSLVSFGLAGVRFALTPDATAVIGVLVACGVGLAATTLAGKRGRLGFASWSLPIIGLLGTYGLPVLEGGLVSESLAWLPTVPLVAVFLLGTRRALVIVLVALLLVTGIALAHVFRPGLYPDLALADVGIRFASAAGALVFSTVLGFAYESSRKGAAENLEFAHRQMHALVENLRAGVAITDDQARIVSINQRLCDIFGLSEKPEALMGRDTWAVLESGSNTPDDPKQFRRRIIEVALSGRPAEDEVRMNDGAIYQRDFLALDLDGGVSGHMWSYHDITEHKTREQRLIQHAQVDELTGLASRGHFLELLDGLCESRGSPEPVCLLYLDLDGFKEVNDLHGHGAGDQVLSAVGSRMRASVRRDDVAARLGGDEFAVLLWNTHDRAGATIVAEKLIAALSEPVELSCETAVQVGASVGVVLRPCNSSPAELLKEADEAMYEAKRAGKGVYRVAAGSAA